MSVVQDAEAFVQERLGKDPTGHDWWHAYVEEFIDHFLREWNR